MARLVALLPVLLIASGCGRSPSEELARLSDEFVTTTLTFYPSAATAAGLHKAGSQNLDEAMEDMSPETLGRQLRFYQDFRTRLGKLRTDKLTAEDRVDLQLLQDECALEILDIADVQSAVHNPMMYAETAGAALFTPFTLEYAPKPERIRHIIARLGKLPLFLNQAVTNLTSAPLVWTQIAEGETEANVTLVDKTIRDGVPDNLKDAYGRAAQQALAALHKYDDFLKNSLSVRDASWRLGEDHYRRKFRLVMHGAMEADNALERATRDMTSMRAHMMDIALPLHAEMEPKHHDHDDLSGDERQNVVIGEVLKKIAGRHSTRESYMDDARKDLDEARAFVQEHQLVTLPAQSNLQVIPTPEFERAEYATGGFFPAPALQPQLGAYYWITPIPPEWTAEQADSKLREYNEFMLRLLTMHEAIPGHWVQFEIASGMQPPSRRVLRSLYGSDAYVEGWAQYAEQAMLEQGYLNHSKELELTFAKVQLRVIANAILDVRMQMLNMSDQEAMDFLEKQAFQEHQEAIEKLQRAKSTSGQLPTYYVGWLGWTNVRDAIRKARGGAFNLTDFHDRALKEGAVPLGTLQDLILRTVQQP